MNEFKTDVQGTKDIYTIEYRTNSRANYEEAQNLLRKFVDNKPRTNFDHITESAESLARCMASMDFCPFNRNGVIVTCNKNCIECFMEWLQQEAD